MSERACRKGVGVLRQSGPWVEMWAPLVRTGKCVVEADSFHATIAKQSIGNGSSDRVLMWKPTGRTCKHSSVERLGYFSRLLCLEWHATKWHVFTAESWVAAAHAVCSPPRAHLQAGTAAPARRVWLPRYCGCHWYEWIDTPRSFLRSSLQIHSCKCNEGLWERADTHE